MEWDSIARVIDCFADHIDIKELGFEKTESGFEGRACYDSQSMLKMYLYGYRKNIRSSRKKGMFRKFINRVTVDVKTGYVSIYESKFKAWNGKDCMTNPFPNSWRTVPAGKRCAGKASEKRFDEICQ